MYKLKKITGVEDIKGYLLAALFFFLPLYPKLSSACIIGYVLLSLVRFKRNKLILLWQKKELFLFVLVYLILVLGLSYTINLENGFSKIQTQLSFLIFPVFFVDSFQKSGDRASYFEYFNWGLLATVLICIINGLRRLFTGDGMYVIDAFSEKHNVFLYQEFSGLLDLHPSYFALYLGTALFYLIFFLHPKTSAKQGLRWLMLLVFFVALFLTSSKAGIFSFILISLGFQVYRSVRRKNKADLGIFAILIAAIVFMFVTNPLIYNRSIQAVKSMNKYVLGENAVNESTSKRFGLWHISLKQIKKQPLLGYGTGSTNRILNNSCIAFFSFSVCEGLRHKNTHNQYLNLFLSNGILLILPFLMALFLALRMAFINRDGLYFLCISFVCINFFFESLLERERGVLFFMLFLVLLSTTLKTSIANNNE